ncbi:MAG: FemAB family PEP-CTERM system-associated protein [Patescibacteria group bacterium]|nr:FemAB family PEP-CTERM system-associated protein [Patescibacteria group bacterium]
MIKVELLQKKDEKSWDEFASKAKNSSFCHKLAWRKVVREAYNHQDLYLVAKEENIKGILPCFIIAHPLFGKRIISLPFCGQGGVVGENKIVQELFVNYLKNYVKEKKYDFFELRMLVPISGLSADLSQFTFILPLNKSADILWNNLNRKTRNQVRKSNRFNLRVEIGNNYLRNFYQLYQKSMKRLGTPVHSKAFMEKVIKEFPGQAEIIMAKFSDEFVAGLFILYYEDTAFNLWGASDSKYASMNINDFLYWETIKRCAGNDYSYFDFGRSQAKSGTFHFKQQWGANPKQLYYYRYSSNNKAITSDKDKYYFAAKIWRRLPLSFVNLVGPGLRKYIP